jgi:hypothetical protein
MVGSGRPPLHRKQSAPLVGNAALAGIILALGVAGLVATVFQPAAGSIAWSLVFIAGGTWLVRDARRRWGREGGDYKAVRVWTYLAVTVVVLAAAFLGWMILAVLFRFWQ